MQRIRLPNLGTLLAMALLIVGCASPHYLQVDPRVTADLPQSGSGQQVTLSVVDGRDSEVLGTRSGAAMSTATITVNAHELVPKLQAQAEQALGRMGYTPTAQSAEGRPSLTLTLDRLDYGRGETRPLIDEARLEAELRAVAVNGGTTFTGVYTSKRTQGYAVRPDLEANTAMVNELLGDALNRAFRDPELSQLLAR